MDRFLKYYQHGPSKPFNQIVASYLETMETDSRFAAWEVKQAADAVLLYAEKYLKSDKRFIALLTSDSIELKSSISNSGKNLHDWKKIFIRLHENMCLRHYSPRTEKSYRIWLNKFRNHLNSRDPLTLEGKDVKEYLTHIALRERVSASTQHQAFNALLFFFRNILQKSLDDLTNIVRARQNRRLPVVLTCEEIYHLFSFLEGPYLLIIRSGKGKKDRTTVLPERIKDSLKSHLQRIKQMHDQDLANGYGATTLPKGLEKKYPNANKEWAWQRVFPSRSLVVHSLGGRIMRHHIQSSTLQRMIKRALRKSKISNHASCHTLRNSFATHLLEAGYNIRTIQELMGHKNVNTPMIYTHVARKSYSDISSPLEKL